MNTKTIEQKAAAYDLAFEKAKKELKACGSLDCDAARQIFRYFPELKESEDEKIRKELIKLINDLWAGKKALMAYREDYEKYIAWLEKQGEKSYEELSQTPHKYNVGDWIVSKYNLNSIFQVKEVLKRSYNLLDVNNAEEINSISIVDNSSRLLCMEDIQDLLEKQGKQKPADEVEPKFKVGDWVVFNDKHDSIYQVENIENYQYTLKHTLGGLMPLSFSSETMIRLWSIEDAKDDDVLAVDGRPFIYDRNANQFVVGGDYGITIYGPFKKCKETVGGWTVYDTDIYPATKEQRELLFQTMKEAGYEWDAEKKELKKIEQKSAEWTEEDEITQGSLINLVEMFYGDINQDEKNRLIDWLKSLRPQNHWKPNMAQINALYAAIKQVDKGNADVLKGLYEKLMGLIQE